MESTQVLADTQKERKKCPPSNITFFPFSFRLNHCWEGLSSMRRHKLRVGGTAYQWRKVYSIRNKCSYCLFVLTMTNIFIISTPLLSFIHLFSHDIVTHCGISLLSHGKVFPAIFIFNSLISYMYMHKNVTCTQFSLVFNHTNKLTWIIMKLIRFFLSVLYT